MPTREYIVKTNDYARAQLFPVRRKATGKRGKRNKPTRETQEKLNQKNRERMLADILHLNYTDKDYFIRLSYSDENNPATIAEADAMLYNYFRRIRYLRKKQGLPPLKAVYVTEQGTKSGRIHHHVFLNGDIDRDTLEGLWKNGYANTRRLQFNEHGLVGLSKYCAKGKKAKEAKERQEETVARTWNTTRGLKRPQPNTEIFQNDYRVKASDVAYIDEHPDDLRYIENLYPDYFVAAVETTPKEETPEAVTEEINPIPQARFVTLYLYRRDAKLINTPYENGGIRRDKKPTTTHKRR